MPRGLFKPLFVFGQKPAYSLKILSSIQSPKRRNSLTNNHSLSEGLWPFPNLSSLCGNLGVPRIGIALSPLLAKSRFHLQTSLRSLTPLSIKACAIVHLAAILPFAYGFSVLPLPKLQMSLLFSKAEPYKPCRDLVQLLRWFQNPSEYGSHEAI